MKILNKLLRRNAQSQGIVGISFIANGIAVAIAQWQDRQFTQLTHCEFIATESTSERADVLSALVDRHHLNKYDCYLVLDYDDYRLITLEAPNVPDNELREAIRWKVDDMLEFSAENAVIDSFPMPLPRGNDEKKLIESVVCSPDMTSELSSLCNAAKLKLKVIDISEMALRNLVCHNLQATQGSAVLHLQSQSGKVIILQNNIIYLSRKIDFGFNRLRNGNSSQAHEQTTLELNSLALEVQRSLDYVESFFGIPAITTLLIIPIPVNNTDILLDIFNNSYGISAQILNLPEQLNIDFEVDTETLSQCATAIGVTLRHTLEQT